MEGSIYILRWIDGYFKKLAKHPVYESAVAGCKHTELMIPVEEGEGGQVPLHLLISIFISSFWYLKVRVLVHTPVHLAESGTNAGLVYAHGGAVLSGSAQLYKPHLSLLAVNCGMPVFNVDYRQCT